MRKKIIVLALLVVSNLLFSVDFSKLDKSHSEVIFTATHLLISEVNGNFNDIDFSLEVDKKNKIKSLSGRVRVVSVDTRNDDRDNHLKSSDFFESNKYPEMTFESTSYKGNSKKGKLTGYLTIKDIKKKVTFKVKQSKVINFKNKKRVAIILTGDLKRKDFDVGSGVPNAIVDDELLIKIILEFTE